MRDDEIAAALSLRCVCCLAPSGTECVDPKTGQLLMETAGRPVHVKRLEP